MSGPPPDYTGNPTARANRTAKAEALAAWCLENKQDPYVLLIPANGKLRARAARLAGVRPSSLETWQETVTLYDRARGWA